MSDQPRPRDHDQLPPLPARRILVTWWPLAASWLLMAVESPALTAVVARLAAPEVNLAAFGGVVWPLALIIESPIIMLLSASTALSKDWRSYRRVRRFMMTAGALLTVLHVLVVFTPLYYVVVTRLIGAPPEIIEPARLGLKIMVPWTWAIAYRRFNQGVLIRFGHSRAVGLGTLIRLCADGAVLVTGYLLRTVPGIAVAASALSAGVISEALFVGLRVRPVLHRELGQAPPVAQPLTLALFAQFYAPLALTSLLNLVVQPIGSAALSRMPHALESLAVWSVVSGFVFLLRSLGMAYNEVVIALLDEPRSLHNLRRIAAVLTVVTSALLLVIVATPLAPFWFGRVSGLSPQLATLARQALWLAIPIPAFNVLQSWYQGAIVHSRRTRGITEAVAIFLLTNSAILWAGVRWGEVIGLYVGMAAFSAGGLAQTLWLWYRSRPAMRAVEADDASTTLLQPADACAP
jgi:hypothetical protein